MKCSGWGMKDAVSSGVMKGSKQFVGIREDDWEFVGDRAE
jgi:hypothetical protein